MLEHSSELGFVPSVCVDSMRYPSTANNPVSMRSTEELLLSLSKTKELIQPSDMCLCPEERVYHVPSVHAGSCCRSSCCTCPSQSPAPKLGRQAGRVARKAGVIKSAAHNTICPNMTSSYNLDFLPEMMVDGRLLGTGERM
ncbi:hypothetical protein E1301_Tti001864 [Triplophysa tibetana]|uniref:Uncharacterized protein n=1 Tax=Triplophysa tibetana TaxID=1572043 RepID=A0A5A9PJH9_9TELE|nr:hypothetical protein E1301_Tti001864 [Triplophysa tibetana]